MKRSKPQVPLTSLSLVLLFTTAAAPSASPASSIKIVAAENFYGDVARQIGGDRISVMSIMSDPNVNPSEYESNAEYARAVADADLVIENGGGYDAWMDRLISASPNGSRIVLKALDLAVRRLQGSEHVWYSVDNIQAVAIAISRILERIVPQSAAVFSSNDRAFQESLGPIREKMRTISSRYAGTPVGITETMYLYQVAPLGLAVLTPMEFQKAITEGKDPPEGSVVTTGNQIKQHEIRILICNDQTITPLSAKVEAQAKAANIPVVGMTETLPPGETYQTWMLRQLDELRSALIFASS